MPKSETPKCNQHAYKQVRVTLIIRIFAFFKADIFSYPAKYDDIKGRTKV